MRIKGKDLKNLIKESIEQDFLHESSIDDGSGYTFDVSNNGIIKIVGRPNGDKTPKTLGPKSAANTARALKKLGKSHPGLDAAIKKMDDTGSVGQSAPSKPAKTDSTSSGKPTEKDLEGWSTKLKRIMMFIPDTMCAPDFIPLWVYPFFCFLGLRDTPLALSNRVYRECLHRICDIAKTKGRSIAGPVDIEYAQATDPVWSLNPQGIVGTSEIPFGGDWSHGYDYTSKNPYMHIAMSLTNFKFSGPPGGPYEVTDRYDFNEPGKADAPLGNPKYMLQKIEGWQNLPKTVKQHLKSGLFSVIEDLMRYYEATLNYGGFIIEATTVAPIGYKRPKFKKK